MIQEVVVGGAVEDRKTPSNNNSSPPAPSPSPENLRCPRCDSANTKFCYYNNYNLTQPRHFCKTCRRYWTKGGALRNVPIGGGCRKTKAAAAAALVPAVKSRTSSRALGPTDPTLWGGCTVVDPHSSHLLSLLRATQAQYYPPQHDSSISRILSEEGSGSGSMNVVGPGSDPYYDHYQLSQNLFLGDVPTSSGIQELYQRLRGNENLIVMGSGNVDNNSAGSSFSAAAATTAATSNFLEPMPMPMMPMPLSGGDFGYGWNPGMGWADISLPNGAFP